MRDWYNLKLADGSELWLRPEQLLAVQTLPKGGGYVVHTAFGTQVLDPTFDFGAEMRRVEQLAGKWSRWLPAQLAGK